MKIAIHAKPRNLFAAMLAMSLQRLRHEIVIESRDDWTGPVPGVDLAIVHGIRQPALEAYAGIPAIVLESGYLHRVNTVSEAQIGHWQLSLGGLNVIPDFPCAPDRFDRLSLAIEKPVKRKEGYVLLLGQTPNDSALGGVDHLAWLQEQAEMYRSQDLEVRYRPHPRGGIELPGVETIPGTLDDALEGASLAVMYNSTAGFQVLLKGIPVICDPCAPYAELAGKNAPSVKARRSFFNRAAYGQWRVDETEQAVNFLLNEWLPKCRS